MPNADTSEIRRKARRVKDHILTQYIKLADRVDDKGLSDLSEKEESRYWEFTKEFARNVVPRSQEVTGEDGEPVKLVFDPVFKNGITRQTEADSGESSQIQDS